MALPFVLVLTGILLAMQLVLCFKVKRNWFRFLPLIFTALAALACRIGYFFGFFHEIYGASFAFYIYGIVLLLMAGAELLAWGLYAIVKLIQKRRK